MIQFYPIASSSEGNVTWIKTDMASILIDCGISLRKLKSSIGEDAIKNLDAVFITHEHSDHIKGLGPLGRAYPDIKIYINESSYNKYSSNKSDNPLKSIVYSNIQAGDIIIIGDLEVVPFTTKHDSVNSFGFRVRQLDTNLQFTFLTDTGSISPLMKKMIKGSDVIFLEADYDVDGLEKYAGYPEDIKERISSNFGHLSTDQALELIEEMGISNFQKIFFGHLSPRTNSPKLVKEAILKKFPDHVDLFEIAPLQGKPYAIL